MKKENKEEKGALLLFLCVLNPGKSKKGEGEREKRNKNT